MNKLLYPRNWPMIRQEILARADFQCECNGLCGLVDHFPRCPEKHNTPALHFRGYVILTTAHLNRNTKDNRRSNLKSLCAACHLRYDNSANTFHSVITRDRNRGQLRLGLAERVSDFSNL